MRAFFGIGVRMRISEKAVRPQTKGRRSMPVAAGKESSGGGANSVTPTNKKLAEMRAFFGIGVRMRISEKAVRPQTKGRRSMPVAAGKKSSGGEANSVPTFYIFKRYDI